MLKLIQSLLLLVVLFMWATIMAGVVLYYELGGIIEMGIIYFVCGVVYVLWEREK